MDQRTVGDCIKKNDSEEYVIDEEFTSSMASVYRVHKRHTNAEGGQTEDDAAYVVKVFECKAEDVGRNGEKLDHQGRGTTMYERYLRENEILKELSDDTRFMRWVDNFETASLLPDEVESKRYFCIVTKFAAGGNLHKFKNGRVIDASYLALIAKFFEQITEGLVKLHDKHIMHMDLKADNILLDELGDGKQSAVICDFGLSRKVVDCFRVPPTKQCERFAPPEATGNDKMYTVYGDSWQLALMICSLVTKYYLVGTKEDGEVNCNPKELAKYVADCKKTCHQHNSLALYNVVSKVLLDERDGVRVGPADYYKRPTMAEIYYDLRNSVGHVFNVEFPMKRQLVVANKLRQPSAWKVYCKEDAAYYTVVETPVQKYDVDYKYLADEFFKWKHPNISYVRYYSFENRKRPESSAQVGSNSVPSDSLSSGGVASQGSDVLPSYGVYRFATEYCEEGAILESKAYMADARSLPKAVWLGKVVRYAYQIANALSFLHRRKQAVVTCLDDVVQLRVDCTVTLVLPMIPRKADDRVDSDLTLIRKNMRQFRDLLLRMICRSRSVPTDRAVREECEECGYGSLCELCLDLENGQHHISAWDARERLEAIMFQSETSHLPGWRSIAEVDDDSIAPALLRDVMVEAAVVSELQQCMPQRAGDFAVHLDTLLKIALRRRASEGEGERVLLSLPQRVCDMLVLFLRSYALQATGTDEEQRNIVMKVMSLFEFLAECEVGAERIVRAGLPSTIRELMSSCHVPDADKVAARRLLRVVSARSQSPLALRALVYLRSLRKRNNTCDDEDDKGILDACIARLQKRGQLGDNDLNRMELDVLEFIDTQKSLRKVLVDLVATCIERSGDWSLSSHFDTAADGDTDPDHGSSISTVVSIIVAKLSRALRALDDSNTLNALVELAQTVHCAPANSDVRLVCMEVLKAHIDCADLVDVLKVVSAENLSEGLRELCLGRVTELVPSATSSDLEKVLNYVLRDRKMATAEDAWKATLDTWFAKTSTESDVIPILQAVSSEGEVSKTLWGVCHDRMTDRYARTDSCTLAKFLSDVLNSSGITDAARICDTVVKKYVEGLEGEDAIGALNAVCEHFMTVACTDGHSEVAVLCKVWAQVPRLRCSWCAYLAKKLRGDRFPPEDPDKRREYEDRWRVFKEALRDIKMPSTRHQLRLIVFVLTPCEWAIGKPSEYILPNVAIPQLFSLLGKPGETTRPNLYKQILKVILKSDPSSLQEHPEFCKILSNELVWSRIQEVLKGMKDGDEKAKMQAGLNLLHTTEVTDADRQRIQKLLEECYAVPLNADNAGADVISS